MQEPITNVPDVPTERLHVHCAWCGLVLVTGDVGARISHGICDNCRDAWAAQDTWIAERVERRRLAEARR